MKVLKNSKLIAFVLAILLCISLHFNFRPEYVNTALSISFATNGGSKVTCLTDIHYTKEQNEQRLFQFLEILETARDVDISTISSFDGSRFINFNLSNQNYRKDYELYHVDDFSYIKNHDRVRILDTEGTNKLLDMARNKEYLERN